VERLCGEMQLPLKELYNYTPRQFQNYTIGFMESRDSKFKSDLYNTRWISYWAAIGFLKKGTKPEQLITFPWEEESDQELKLMPTEEEVQKARDFWKEIDKKREHGKTSS